MTVADPEWTAETRKRLEEDAHWLEQGLDDAIACHGVGARIRSALAHIGRLEARIGELEGALRDIKSLPSRQTFPHGGAWNHDMLLGLRSGRQEAAYMALDALSPSPEPDTKSPRTILE